MKIEEMLKTFNSDQVDMFHILESQDKYQFRVPTGVGKGYVMILHILNSIINSDDRIFAIASHRLSLNNQHVKDLINHVINLKLINKVKFLTVGSKSLNVIEILNTEKDLAKKLNNELFEFNFGKAMRDMITVNDIFQTSMSDKEINKIIKKNDKLGFKTIIVTTYNSLSKIRNNKLDIIYNDEAHILASDREDADFKKSYESINAKKTFFFTATPKDVEDQLLKEGEKSDIFLMNNKDVFGEIFTVPFRKCVESGYITKPVLHIAKPADLKEGDNYDSIENKAKFVKDTFIAHEEWLYENSYKPDEIGAKVLVRCESVPNMWEMHTKLKEIMPDVTICAGASYNDGAEENHVIGDEWVKDRDIFIDKLQKIKDTDRVIILQFDIFSEGLNVPGITGVMFLQGKMPSRAKIIQNIGRATRLHRIDRDRFRRGELKVGEGGWIKPNCAVIVPYWDSRSEFTKTQLASLVRSMRDDWGFEPQIRLSLGDDLAEGDGKNEDEGLNKLDKGEKKTKLIKEIENEIEVLELNDEAVKEQEYLETLDPEERNHYILTKIQGIKID
jgi:superfamily II DNA or RNA helicase